MDTSHRKPSIASGNQSVAGDRDSRISEISSSTISTNLKRLFDFSQLKIPGLYRVTPKHFILEYCESDAIAYSKFHISHTTFTPKYIEEPITIKGLQYCGCIELFFGNNTSQKVLIPAFRSYDPAGKSGRQYLNTRQFLLCAKLLSAEIRAIQLGVREKRIDKIKRSIESVSSIPESFLLLWNWTHLQIKLACYKRLTPPKYFEYILNKVLTEEFSLDGRDDCKEYLEKCLQGNEIRLPSAYYKSVLAHERKLPFDMRVLFSEFENRENKEEKASAAFLQFLPKLVAGFTCVKEGKSFTKMVTDCERLSKLYENNVHQNKCKVM